MLLWGLWFPADSPAHPYCSSAAVVGEYFAAYNIYEFGSNDTTTAFFYLNLAAVACTMYGLQAVFLGFQVLENVIPDAKLQNVAVHIVLGPLVIQELVISILAGE